MKKISIKKYFYAILLIVITIVLSLLLSKIYINKNKNYSLLYNYSNSISTNEFSEYISENPDTIIYISSKYNTKYDAFEKDFVNQLEIHNLKSKIVYINIEEVDEDFIVYLNENFDLEFKGNPILIVFIDGNLNKYVTIDNSLDAEDIINYEVFK